MGPLEFFLLGPPRIQRDAQPVISPEQVRVFALGAYLAMEGNRPCPRGALAGLLWPDKEEVRARHNLRQALSTLRQLVEPDGALPVMDSRRETIALRLDTCTIDALDVMALLDACATHPHHDRVACTACLARVERVQELYTGPFLDRFFLPGSDLYQEWLERWRQRLHDRVVDAMDVLVAAHRQRRDYEGAYRAVQRQLELAPYREATHRHLMSLESESGNRSSALRQFEGLRQMLEDELDVEPDPETVVLYLAIRDGADRLHRAPPPATGPVHLPVPPTRLIGREQEQAEIADLLGHRDCRLLTLHGPGGSGKTRLAIAMAQAHADATGDIVAFIQLAGKAGTEGIVAAIATELGVAAQGPGTPDTHLLAWIRERRVFLVLDNAEHLASELEFIETMLATTQNLTILVTSRKRLGLPGEWIYDLPGLTYPRSLAR